MADVLNEKHLYTFICHCNLVNPVYKQHHVTNKTYMRQTFKQLFSCTNIILYIISLTLPHALSYLTDCYNNACVMSAFNGLSLLLINCMIGIE